MQKTPEKNVIFTFDIEEFDILSDFNFKIDAAAALSIERRSTEKLISFLEEIELPATGFLTAHYAERHRSLAKELAGLDFEIACHGYHHADDYRDFDRGLLSKRLAAAIDAIEGITGKDISGHRSPRLCPVEFEVLKRAGFQYDSSIHPTYVPFRYNHLKERRLPYRREGMIEMPITTSRSLSTPISWLWFRTYPWRLLQHITEKLAGAGCPIIVYFHNWEFLDFALEEEIRPKLFFSKCGTALEKRLIDWIALLKKYDYRPVKMCDYISNKFADSQE